MTLGIVLIYDWYRKVGIDIQITFKRVEGLVPRQSKILYKGAQIGTVDQIDLDENNNPVVKARIIKTARKLLNKGSSFWVVEPELGVGSINNLSAISTGCYIAMNPGFGEFADKFIGLKNDPVAECLDNGLMINLKAKTANGINIGTSILYRGLTIGEVGDLTLSKNKKEVIITVYIAKKFTGVVRKDSIFANISGFHADISLFSGSRISVDSLATLVKGGIIVKTNNFNTAPAKTGDVFNMLNVEQLQDFESGH